MQERIDKMLKLDMIERSTKSWNCPVLLLKKSDGGVRFVYDARGLNKVTEAEVMSMPKIDEILSSSQFWTMYKASSKS